MWYQVAIPTVAVVWASYGHVSVAACILGALSWLFALQARPSWRAEVAFEHASVGLVLQLLGIPLRQPPGKSFNPQERLWFIGMSAALVWLKINIISTGLKHTVLNSNYTDGVCDLLHPDKCEIVNLLQDELDSVVCFLFVGLCDKVLSQVFLKDTMKDILQRDYEHRHYDHADYVQSRTLTRFAQACTAVWLLLFLGLGIMWKMTPKEKWFYPVMNFEETTFEWLNAMQMGILLEVVWITVRFYWKAMERKLGYPVFRLPMGSCWSTIREGLPLLDDDYQRWPLELGGEAVVVGAGTEGQHQLPAMLEDSLQKAVRTEKIFRAIDTDHSGDITINEVIEVALPDDDLNFLHFRDGGSSWHELVDGDQNGQITFEELLRFVLINGSEA